MECLESQIEDLGATSSGDGADMSLGSYIPVFNKRNVNKRDREDNNSPNETVIQKYSRLSESENDRIEKLIFIKGVSESL